MTINTKYDIGNKVFILTGRTESKNLEHVLGEIDRIMIYKTNSERVPEERRYSIRYVVKYICGNEHFEAYVWEEDLIRYGNEI